MDHSYGNHIYPLSSRCINRLWTMSHRSSLIDPEATIQESTV